MMFFTGYSRTASEVAKDQIEQIPNKKLNLRQMMQNVDEAEAILLDKSDRLDDFGRLLHEQWKLKRELSSKISTSQIDEIYETGIKIGALGGKLIGAGGGGFMLFIARPEQQDRIKAALSGLLYVPAASISWAARSLLLASRRVLGPGGGRWKRFSREIEGLRRSTCEIPARILCLCRTGCA